MRVSLLILFFVVFCVAEAPDGASAFDQSKWNRGVAEILGSFWITSFGDQFTPQNFVANITRESRLLIQCNRLRARVGRRLAESLEDSEIICQQDYFSVEAFVQVEKELKEKGWDVHWIPKTLERECGPQSKGFLYVKLK